MDIRRRPEWLARLSGTLPIVLLGVVLVLAACLRLDAMTKRFGQVSQPAALRLLQDAAQTVIDALHRPLGDWSPEPEYPHQDDRPSRYRSDPYTYTKWARDMGSFYSAHYREPVFPFVVKLYLPILNDQDIAVSFASASFSLLCVLAAFFLGAMAFSRWVGCLAAAGMAIERDVIWWGVAGWRDDAFTFAVMLSICSMLYYRRKPSMASAVALGASAAFACLTRIFAVSFLAPAFLYLLLWSEGSWRHRLRDLTIASISAAALVAPYLVNCWLEFGDPLYTLNYQPIAYLGWEGTQPSTTPGAFGYIGGKLLAAPVRTLDTAALGMTSYPFLNKWAGFEPWLPGLGHWLAGAALLGLILHAASWNGRLLLLVLAAALVPFAFTWRLSADWRYTEFAYPFLLIAAGLAITNLAALARPSRWKSLGARIPPLRTVGGWALLLAGIAIVAWVILRVLPVLSVREALLANEAGLIEAGPRDGLFFREGWSDTVKTVNVTARVSRGRRSVVYIPLPRAAEYTLTVRLDPFPPPSAGDVLPSVRVFFNGVLVRWVPMTWNPERVGSYDLSLRQAWVKPGMNSLAFVGDRASAEGPASGRQSDPSFKLWYVLVQPIPVLAK